MEMLPSADASFFGSERRHPYLLMDCKEGNDVANRLSSEAKHSSDGSVLYSLIRRDFLILCSVKAVLQAGEG